ncbi:MAG: hypothetical protein QM820_57000 [Minicystis sp.]
MVRKPGARGARKMQAARSGVGSRLDGTGRGRRRDGCEAEGGDEEDEAEGGDEEDEAEGGLRSQERQRKADETTARTEGLGGRCTGTGYDGSPGGSTSGCLDVLDRGRRSPTIQPMKSKTGPAAKRIARNPFTGETVVLASKKPAAKKPSAKKPSSKKSVAASGLLRGVALVDAVMDARRKKGEKLKGTPRAEVDAMRFGTAPLSPALARWIENDAEMFTLGEPEPLGEMLRREVDVWAEAFADLEKFLTGPCVLFEGWGCDSRRFLYLGATDALGEYPVFTIDTDDTPFACINGPVDVWLAQHAGFLEDEDVYGAVPAAYEPARKALAKICFDGYVSYVDGAFSKKLDPYGD